MSRHRTGGVEKRVALATTLSDVSMINFCRPGLDAIIGQGLDYLFCNEEEAQVWCGSQDLQVRAWDASKATSKSSGLQLVAGFPKV